MKRSGPRLPCVRGAVMAQAMTEGLTIPQSRLTPCQPPLHKGAFGCGGINGHIKPPYPPRKAADAARADVGIGPYTSHSIFRPNRRSGISRPPGRAAGGLSPSAGGQRFRRRGAHCASVWPRRLRAFAEQTRLWRVRADVGIGPYTPHSIFRPNRRGGYQPPAWSRCRRAFAERRGAAIPS